MAIIKSYTDLQQSKKLAKILPLESADMCWFEGEPFVEAVTGYEEERAESHRQAGMEMYPCWSLASLLGVLPKETNISTPDPLNKIRYSCWNNYDITYASNPVDACVVMIERLHELNLL